MKKHNQKHLTLSDRIYIEQELLQGNSFANIAKTLHNDPSTISKEVKRNRTYYAPDRFRSKCKGCVHYADCTEHHVCDDIKCKKTTLKSTLENGPYTLDLFIQTLHCGKNRLVCVYNCHCSKQKTTQTTPAATAIMMNMMIIWSTAPAHLPRG